MRIVWMIFFFLCATVLYADETTQIKIQQKDAQFSLELPANPTTGYQWKVLSYDKKRFQWIESHYQRPQTKLIGAPGITRFTFKVLKNYPSKTVMIFCYARPWEKHSGSKRTVEITFTPPSRM